MDAAATLFRVTFRQEMNVPAWDPSVETWDVIDNGKMIGRFYLDMHPRPGKHGHPEMATVLDGIRGKQLPEAALVCSFPEPTAADPGLLEYDDVVNFFHEFGHLMHHILGGQQPWAGISGIAMETDFWEAPSQMLEEWIHSPQVLASFAHDYKTGKPIPADLVARMNRASAFGRAIDVTFQTAMSAASYNVYSGKPEKVDLEAIFPDAFWRYTLVAPVPADAHMYANFIYLGGYPYYVYMWDLVIAEDFFQQFDQHNLFAGDIPMRYRRLVLEPGGSMSANDLVKNFLGRPQNMTAFQKWMGEEFESAPRAKRRANTRQSATGQPWKDSGLTPTTSCGSGWMVSKPSLTGLRTGSPSSRRKPRPALARSPFRAARSCAKLRIPAGNNSSGKLKVIKYIFSGSEQLWRSRHRTAFQC
jgi:thimet oligopeptidase